MRRVFPLWLVLAGCASEAPRPETRSPVPLPPATVREVPGEAREAPAPPALSPAFTLAGKVVEHCSIADRALGSAEVLILGAATPAGARTQRDGTFSVDFDPGTGKLAINAAGYEVALPDSFADGDYAMVIVPCSDPAMRAQDVTVANVTWTRSAKAGTGNLPKRLNRMQGRREGEVEDVGSDRPTNEHYYPRGNR